MVLCGILRYAAGGHARTIKLELWSSAQVVAGRNIQRVNQGMA